MHMHLPAHMLQFESKASHCEEALSQCATTQPFTASGILLSVRWKQWTEQELERGGLWLGARENGVLERNLEHWV